MSIFNAPRNNSLGSNPLSPGPTPYTVDDPWGFASAPALPNAGSAAGVGAGTGAAPKSRSPTSGPSNLSSSLNGAGSASHDRESAQAAAADLALPPIYERAYALAGPQPDSTDGEISLGQLHRILSSSGLGAALIERIINLSCGRPRCSKAEFAIAIALVAQAQAGQDIDVGTASDALERSDLPLPSLDLANLPASTSSVINSFPPTLVSSPRAAGPPRDISDPWHTSALSVPGASGSQGEASSAGLPAHANGFGSTLRGFASSTPNLGAGLPEDDETEGFGSMLGGGPSRYLSDSAPHSRIGANSPAADPVGSEAPEDEVTVRLRAELEGFIFKHNAYVVTSRLRGSSVTRRYSDFAWLADALVRRYPFRCLPVLPPKRLSIPVAGRHLSADDNFLEKRRRGLQRYLKALVAHPVLRQDNLVSTFFTETSSLSTWRTNSAPLALEDECLTSHLDELDVQSIPTDLEGKVAKTKAVTATMVERWSSVCNIFERILKRSDAASADYARLTFSMNSLIETSNGRWRPESDKRKALEENLGKLSGAFHEHADLMGARAQALIVSTLEGLKYQRDLWCSFRDLLVRHERLSPDTIPSLRARIEVLQTRFSTIRAERKVGWEKELEKVRLSIERDGASVEALLRRRVHTRWAMWNELCWIHRVSRGVEAEWRTYAAKERIWAKADWENWDQLALVLDSIAGT